ncbi:hypothetical protein NP233_g2106 [Leucocoprinus birnbaumii]|uniref:L-lysine 6-oxidase n=1 Tax=Leucocoprinus birnbaumii TaxID=56174 RepID=A0AAD5W0W3_9AGAR|nr:hypothetical protein NP233_g2106 [Leucocoprinus birnbaumii]
MSPSDCRTIFPDENILGERPELGRASGSPSGTGDFASIAIFPPLGIARFGDSKTEYFLASEVPGRTAHPRKVETFRDSTQKIRRQAVRFRVYAFDRNRNCLGELHSENGYTLKWSVAVANRKAAHNVFRGRFEKPNQRLRNPDVKGDDRKKLIVASKVESFPRNPNETFFKLDGKFEVVRRSQTHSADVNLGELQLDNAGRLIFIPGTGEAFSITSGKPSRPDIFSEFDNNDWIDNACDGSVKVAVTGDRITENTKLHNAAVCSGPPNFGWGITQPTTLYNVMEDIYHGPITPTGYDFTKDIWPVLASASSISWTNDFGLQGHASQGNFTSSDVIKILQGAASAPRQELKTRIFERLRRPDYEDPSQASVRWMPRLSGDAGDKVDPGSFPRGLKPDIKRFSALTKLQYERFRLWKDEDKPLPNDWKSPESRSDVLEDVQLLNQPDYLTRASLEATNGDPIFPGIEIIKAVKYDMILEGKPNPPFRLKYDSTTQQPGYLTQALSLPWQSDFDLCEIHWWPGVRLDSVVPKERWERAMGDKPTQDDFNAAARERASWKRGLRETDFASGVSRVSADKPWDGSTDMVRNWHLLGFVRKHGKADYPNNDLKGVESQEEVSELLW